MGKNKGGIIVATIVALLLAGGVYVWRASGQPLPVVVAAAAPPAGNDSKITWVGLDRLKAERPEITLGKRNIFGTQPPPPPPPPPTPNPKDPTVPPEPITPTPPTPTPQPAPIPLKYIGMVEPGSGAKKKIAVLLSEQKEILHGREGDVVAGRYRIVKIGIESVDIEDMTASNTQRIPLRGN